MTFEASEQSCCSRLGSHRIARRHRMQVCSLIMSFTKVLVILLFRNPYEVVVLVTERLFVVEPPFQGTISAISARWLYRPVWFPV